MSRAYADRTAVKIDKRIKAIGQHLYSNPTPIQDIAFFQTQKNLPVKEAMARKDWKPCKVGFLWGKPFDTVWFRVRVTIPKSLAGKPVSLRLQTGGQACLFHDGVPVQGLDPGRDEYRLTERAKGGERFELFAESGSHRRFITAEEQKRLSVAQICVPNRELWSCFYTLKFLFNLAKELGANSVRRQRIIRDLEKAVEAFDYENTDPKSLSNSCKAALKAVEEVKSLPAEAGAVKATLAGHSHIDVAWLWPLRETVRKCARTFSTLLQYQKEYPELHFSQSQAQLYYYTKQYYPELYERLKKQFKKGRWEVVGGMWVEADCNLCSGESLVRQMLYGHQFFEEEFGVHSRTFWLPDVFGYTASLPQIIKKCDMDYFMTTKIQWNDVNTFPYTSFIWRGIDGTEVLSHFPPAGTYNGSMQPDQLRKGVDLFYEKDRSNEFLYLYGWGDGGGGPTKEMMENARIGSDMEGVPKLEHGYAQDFFDRLDKNKDELPTWVGELYLELHRGTYTTQSRNKRWNRQCEFLIRDAELAASLQSLSGAKYPGDELKHQWREILKNQFHDIIPGSSVNCVYKRSDKDYAALLKDIPALRDSSLDGLAAKADTRGEGTPVLVLNSLSWNRSAIAEVPVPMGIKNAASVAGPDGAAVPCEISGRGKNRRLRFMAQDVPGIGYSVYHALPGNKPLDASPLKASKTLLENNRLRVRFDNNGLIKSIYDKEAKREIVPRGKRAGVIQMFDDRVTRFDAWEVEADFDHVCADLVEFNSIEVESEGPLEASIRIERSFGKSRLVQTIALGADSKRLDFRTWVDWQEREKMLKAAFPTTINPGAPARATYEIQYGHTERSTHHNTTWDQARFETCGHKWVDIGESNYGVALLNDCKYGHDVKDGQLRLTLLKAPIYPDPLADEGEHEFTYSLFPHIGNFRDAGVIREAYSLNAPLIARETSSSAGPLPAEHAFFSIDAPNVIIEAIKEAEKGKDLIVRVYEAHNARARAALTLPRAAKKAVECNLVERDIEEIKVKGNRIDFQINPFEIKSFKIRF